MWGLGVAESWVVAAWTGRQREREREEGDSFSDIIRVTIFRTTFVFERLTL